MITRRDFVIVFAATAAADILGPLEMTHSQGSTIRLLYFGDVPENEIIKSQQLEFEQRSGIKILVDDRSYGQIDTSIRDSFVVSPNISRDRFDVVWIDDVWLNGYAKQGLLCPLDAEIHRDVAEFTDVYPENVRSSESLVDGRIFMVPQRVDVQVLFFNKAIFQSSDVKKQYQRRVGRELEIPNTWPEYSVVAQGLHGLTFEGSQIVGCAETLGKSNEYHYAFEFFATRYWSMLGATAGGTAARLDFFQQVGGRSEPIFQGAGGVEAIRHLRSLRGCWAEGSDSADHAQTIAQFKEGNVALCPQWYTFYADASLRRALGDRLGVALMPGTHAKTQGGILRTPSFGGGGLGIPTNARDKEKSWAVIRYLTGQRFCETSALKGAIVAREPTYWNPEIKNRNPAVDTYLTSLEFAVPRPRLKQFVEIETIIGERVHAAIMGSGTKPIEAYLDEAARQVTSLLSMPTD